MTGHSDSLARWSKGELARRIARTVEGPAPSASSVARWILAERIGPCRYRNWQPIHDPRQFLQPVLPSVTSVLAASRVFGMNPLPMRGRYKIPCDSRRDPFLIYMVGEIYIWWVSGTPAYPPCCPSWLRQNHLALDLA